MNYSNCWQYLIKLEKCNGIIDIASFINPEVVIKEISYNEADRFIKEYEWLGNIGAAKYCFGLLINSILAGVVCFTEPVSPNAYKILFKLNNHHKILQLCRGASIHWAPKWVPSKLISKSIKLLSKKYKISAIVAYADPEAGEIGTIYQASNARCIGMTDPGGAKYYIINNKKYHPRAVHKKYGSRSKSHLMKIDPNYKTLEIKPKLRYIYILDKSIFNNISSLIITNPKREIDNSGNYT